MEVKWSHTTDTGGTWTAEAFGYILQVSRTPLGSIWAIYKFTLGGVTDDPVKFDRTMRQDLTVTMMLAEQALSELVDEDRQCGWCGERLGKSPRAEVGNRNTDAVLIVHQEPCATSLIDTDDWIIA